MRRELYSQPQPKPRDLLAVRGMLSRGRIQHLSEPASATNLIVLPAA
jgi:hypothetical protein